MLKARLKQVLPDDWAARARRLSRLRWFTKIDVLRYSGVTPRSLRPSHVRYVLWDPEVESHTYDVANLEEMAAFVAGITGVDQAVALDHLHEGAADPVFNAQWARRMRFRFDVKRRAMLGNRLLWWGLVRTSKPKLCVECGIYSGVGSLVLLRALQRNAEEGSPGELVSIDSDPTMGWAVPEDLTGPWTKVVGMTSEVLEDAIGGRKVDLLIHDTPHTYDNARHEFGTALTTAANPLILLDSSGGQTSALRELCDENDGRWSHFREVPAHHFRPVSGTAVGVFLV